MKIQKCAVNQYLIHSVAQFDGLHKRRRVLMRLKCAAITTVCDLAIDPLAFEQDQKLWLAADKASPKA